MVRAKLARLCADLGADDHRPLGAVAVERAEASPPALYRRGSLGPAARCRGRAARRGRRPGLRDGRADRLGRAPAVLAYLFHRIGDRLDGRPTLLIIDEGWLALDDPGFAGQLREWLKTLRKKNASVIFATQSLADIDGSSIAPAIIESCPTRLFLPNERALEPQIATIYRRFGLNDRQIEILSRSVSEA